MPRKPKPQPCACGCGEMTAGYWDNKAKRYALYKGGHHPSHNPPSRRIPRQKLLDDILRIEGIVGRQFRMMDLVKHGKYARNTYDSRLGNYYGILKALGRSWCIDWSVADISPVDGGWLAGITDGEGSFRIARVKMGKRETYAPVYNINLRDDDIDVVRRIRDLFQVHNEIRINTNASRLTGAKPQAVLNIFRTEDLYHKIVPIFEQFPLQSKKKGDFAIFAFLVRYKHDYRIKVGHLHPTYDESDFDLFHRCYLAAQKIKKYKVNLSDVINEYNLPFS